MRRVAGLLVALLSGRVGLADIHYVADARVNPEVNPAYPYTSPGTASFCVMEAAHAAGPGDTVMVLPGTYGSAGVSYWLENGIDLMGSGTDRTFVLAKVSLGRDSMLSALRFEHTEVLARSGAFVNDCVFDGAAVEVTASMNTPATIRRCRFVGGPRTPGARGNIYTYFGSAVALDCTFDLRGEADAIDPYEAGRFEIIGCEFRRCTAAVDSWGGASAVTVSNCLFVANACGVRMQVSPVTIENCTFFGNEYAVWVGWQCDPGPCIKNSILWGTTHADIFVDRSDAFGDPTVTFCDIEGGWPGLGNISANPLFASSSGPEQDFHLIRLSPCVDAGDPFSDYSNEPEPNGGRVNMGAYGNTWEATTSELVDMDADNMRDDWETEHFGNLDRDGFGDADGDGLNDREEYRHLSDPNDPDTDSDGLLDGEEVSLGTDPLVPDTDNDGTPDAEEVAQGTNPLDWKDAFTVLDFSIEEGYLYVTFPTLPGYEYSLESSNWPNGPFGFTVEPYRGRYGLLTHTHVLRLGPYNRFFRIKAREYPGRESPQ